MREDAAVRGRREAMAGQRTHRVLAAMAAVFMLGASAGALAAEYVPGGLGGTEKGGLAGIARDRLEGHTTASGEIYNRNALTAAHRSLPFGTLLRVTNVQNKRSVIVRINDRAPAAGNRVIDLTPRAGAAIGLLGISTAEVKLDVIGRALVAPEEGAPAPAVK